jgi:Zn-dependent protease with chaperone function
MGDERRYGDDPELDAAMRRALARVGLSVLLTSLVLALLMLEIVVRVTRGAGLRLIFETTHGLAVLPLLVLGVAWTLWGLRGQAPSRTLVDANPVPPENPTSQTLARLAGLAGLPVPPLVVIASVTRNSFVYDARAQAPVVCLTQAAWRECTPEQVEAMLAHELFHVAHGDTRLAQRLEGLSALAERRAPRFVANYVLRSVRAMMRQRELSADRAAALLTGRPAAVVSALEACMDGRGSGRTRGRDLREVMSLAFVGVEAHSYPLWSDTHPSLEARVEVLARVATSLGT